MRALHNKSNSAEQTKPMMGEIKSAMPMSLALAQLTPSPKTWPGVIMALANPTPMMEPKRVWELEAGRPKYQVPTFQMMAEIKSEKTMAKPGPEPTWMTSSTGRREMTPKATIPLEVKTPVRFQRPDQTTAIQGLRAWV